MKIELNDNAAFTLIALIIASAVAAIVMRGCSESEQTYREMINSGMVQEQVPANFTNIWTKPDNSK